MEQLEKYEESTFGQDGLDDFSEVFDFDEEYFDNHEEAQNVLEDDDFYRPLREY